MKKKKMVAFGMAVLACMHIFSGCEGKKTELSQRVHVGVACYNQNDTFLGELIDCFKEELGEQETDELESVMTIRDAAGSQRTQNDQVKELIDAGCNILCVNLVDRADPSDIIDLARKKDVPVIFFNREPVAEDMMQWDQIYYVGADAKQSGIMQGELAVDKIRADKEIDRNHDGKIQYVVLEGEPGHQDAIIRTENAVDTLKNNGIELEKLGYGIANWNRVQGQNRMLQMLSQYGDRIELILANNDDMALGAIDAYKKSNIGEADQPVIFGIDGTSSGLDAVGRGTLSGTVYNDKQGQAKAMAMLAYAIVSGTGMDQITFKHDQYIYLPYLKVTKENAGQFSACEENGLKAAAMHEIIEENR